MASKRQQRKRECGEKRKYLGPDAAKAAAERLGQQWYQCRWCQHYHTGHGGGQAKARVRAKGT